MGNENKFVLITGTSSGIGQATAKLFAQNGYSLILTYHLSEIDGQKVAKECKDAGAKDVMLLKLDLKDNQNITEVAEKISRDCRKIDILINNAAYLSAGELSMMPFEEIELQIKTNLEGLIKLTAKFLPLVRKSIINVGSNLGLSGKKNFSVYCATKFGVRGFTKSLAEELPELKIYTVNPALTATKMGNFSGMPPEAVADIIFKAATGKYRAASGTDINVLNYVHGEFLGKIYNLLRSIKKFFV